MENITKPQVIIEKIAPERMNRLKEEKKSQEYKKAIGELISYHFSSLIRGICEDFNKDFPEIIPDKLKYKSKSERKPKQRRGSTESRNSSIVAPFDDSLIVSGRRKTRFTGSFSTYYEPKTEVDKLIEEEGKINKSKKSTSKPAPLKKVKQSPEKSEPPPIQSSSSSSSSSSNKSSSSSSSSSASDDDEDQQIQKPKSRICSLPVNLSDTSSDEETVIKTKSVELKKQQITKENVAVKFGGKPSMLKLQESLRVSSHSENRNKAGESSNFAKSLPMKTSTPIKTFIECQQNDLSKCKLLPIAGLSTKVEIPKPVNSVSHTALSKQSKFDQIKEKFNSNTPRNNDVARKLVPNVKPRGEVAQGSIHSLGSMSNLPPIPKLLLKPKTRVSFPINGTKPKTTKPIIVEPPLVDPMLRKRTNPLKMTTSMSNGGSLSHLGGIFTVDNGWDKPKVEIEKPVEETRTREEIELERAEQQRLRKEQQTCSDYDMDDLLKEAHEVSVDFSFGDDYNRMDESFKNIEDNNESFNGCGKILEESENRQPVEEKKSEMSLVKTAELSNDFNVESQNMASEKSVENYQFEEKIAQASIKDTSKIDVADHVVAEEVIKKTKVIAFDEVKAPEKMEKSIDEVVESEKNDPPKTSEKNKSHIAEKSKEIASDEIEAPEKIEESIEEVIKNDINDPQEITEKSSLHVAAAKSSVVVKVTEKTKEIASDEIKAPVKTEESKDEGTEKGINGFPKNSETDANSTESQENSDLENSKSSSDRDESCSEKSDDEIENRKSPDENDSDSDESRKSTQPYSRKMDDSGDEDILDIDLDDDLDYEYDEPSPDRKKKQTKSLEAVDELSYTTELDDLKLTISKQPVNMGLEMVSEEDAKREFDENSNKISAESRKVQTERNIMKLFPNVCKFYLFGESCNVKCTKHKLPEFEEMRIKIDYKNRSEIIEMFMLMSGNLILFKHYLPFMLETFVKKNMLSEVEKIICATVNFQHESKYYHIIRDALMQHKNLEDFEAIRYIIEHHVPTDIISENAIADLIFESTGRALLHNMSYYENMSKRKNIPFHILIRMMRVFGNSKEPVLGYFILNQLILMDQKNIGALVSHSEELRTFIDYNTFLTEINKDREQKMGVFAQKYGRFIIMKSNVQKQ